MITITESEQMQVQDPEICPTPRWIQRIPANPAKKQAKALTILRCHKVEEGGGDGGGCGIVAHAQPQPLKDKDE